jgi:hypothetical protein
MRAQHSGIIYLACPYTDPSFEVRVSRFQAATKAAAALIKRGHIVFSPITMTHPLDLILAENQSTLGTEFWTAFDEAFMEVCREMVILRLDGWRESAGIERERQFFQAKGRTISFIDP